jgi:hypothetical protein
MQDLTTPNTPHTANAAPGSGEMTLPPLEMQNGEPMENVARIQLSLQVRAASERRAVCVRGELERWILEAGDAEVVSPGVITLALIYSDEFVLDTEVEAWLDDIAIEAQARNCTCTIDAQWGERRWTYGDEREPTDEASVANVIVFPKREKPTLSQPRIWRLRISLLDFTPEIWRRIEIPADISLADLHTILQAAMGWGDMHRYGFGFYGDPERVDIDVDGADRVRLTDICQPGDTIGYTYDMGDTWQHAIGIEAEVQPSARIKYPRCVAGRHACPPEDCGGPPGYAHLLRTLAGRMTAAKRELLDWLGGPFDPNAFRVAEVNARFAELRVGLCDR